MGKVSLTAITANQFLKKQITPLIENGLTGTITIIKGPEAHGSSIDVEYQACYYLSIPGANPGSGQRAADRDRDILFLTYGVYGEHEQALEGATATLRFTPNNTPKALRNVRTTFTLDVTGAAVLPNELAAALTCPRSLLFFGDNDHRCIFPAWCLETQIYTALRQRESLTDSLAREVSKLAQCEQLWNKEQAAPAES